MELKIDDKAIEEEMNRLSTEAIKSAFEDYAIQSAIRDTVSKSVVVSALNIAIMNAVERIDLDAMSNVLSTQLSRTMISGTTLLLRSQAVETIFRLRGGNDFDKDQKEVKAQIAEELKREKVT